jgi:hypothetical protein
VSQLFTNYLRSAYLVERHWLSPFRSQLGHATFKVSIEDASKDGDVPFVIKCNEDALASSKMTNFLSQKRYNAAEQWKQNPPDYYVDVQTTPGPLGSTFGVTSRTFEKVSKVTRNPGGLNCSLPVVPTTEHGTLILVYRFENADYPKSPTHHPRRRSSFSFGSSTSRPKTRRTLRRPSSL